MKRYFLLLLFLFFFSQKSFSQSLRRCGCKTWREWKAASPNTAESRWSKL